RPIPTAGARRPSACRGAGGRAGRRGPRSARASGSRRPSCRRASRRRGRTSVAERRLLAELAGFSATSPWVEVTQERIDGFAAATGDDQWIHIDPARAATGPFGTTIAHGYLTLSLAPGLLYDLLEVEDASLVVNYGLNRVRFPAPVPA